MRAARRRIPAACWLAAALAVVALAWTGCSAPLPVVQGKVVGVSQDGSTLTVQDERAPEAQPMEVSVKGAEIGAPPAVGDEIRFVYRSEGGRNVALRVMNLTRQREMETKGH